MLETGNQSYRHMHSIERNPREKGLFIVKKGALKARDPKRNK